MNPHEKVNLDDARVTLSDRPEGEVWDVEEVTASGLVGVWGPMGEYREVSIDRIVAIVGKQVH